MIEKSPPAENIPPAPVRIAALTLASLSTSRQISASSPWRISSVVFMRPVEFEPLVAGIAVGHWVPPLFVITGLDPVIQAARLQCQTRRCPDQVHGCPIENLDTANTGIVMAAAIYNRHGRTCSGHPRDQRRHCQNGKKAWITGTSPVMTTMTRVDASTLQPISMNHWTAVDSIRPSGKPATHE